MAGAGGEAGSPGRHLIAFEPDRRHPEARKQAVWNEFPASFASLCRSHKTFTYRRKFENRHRMPAILHDLSSAPSTTARSGPLASSADRSELDQAEGHGGAETRGDPGIKADRPGSLIERTGGVSTLTDGRQDQGPRDPSKASAGEDRREPDRDRWTARGSTSWNAGDQERDRIQLTITGVRLADAEARALNLNGQVQPGLGEGTRKTGSPGLFVPSLNFGQPYARDAVARGLRAVHRHPPT